MNIGYVCPPFVFFVIVTLYCANQEPRMFKSIMSGTLLMWVVMAVVFTFDPPQQAGLTHYEFYLASLLMFLVGGMALFLIGFLILKRLKDKEYI